MKQYRVRSWKETGEQQSSKEQTMAQKSSMSRVIRFILFFVPFVLLVPSFSSADLMLYPTRIVLEKNQRASQLELINNGKDTVTYRISLVNYRMSETGEITPIDNPGSGEQFADKMLRFSPRQVTLEPGASQTIRIMVRKPAGLPVGEYRSHLRIERLPDPKGQSSIETQKGNGKNEIGVVLTPLIGASIPVIVRNGDTGATVKLSNLELGKPAPDEAPILSVVMERMGNQSVFGDLTVAFVPTSGTEQVLAQINGVAVYTPNPLRRVKIALRPEPGQVLAHGKVRVTYRERPEADGKELAVAVLQLP
jgi:P pilus assembly chaperone PapD